MWIARLGVLILIVPFLYVAVELVTTEPGWAGFAGALLSAGLGVAIVVRLYRQGVECRQTEIVIRGFLRSRTIQITSIDDVTTFPAVRWKDSRGRRRWTPIIAFMTSGQSIPGINSYNLEAANSIRFWLRSRGARSVRRC